MVLENKRILIISPESWGKNFVSKHHYAKELVKKGNQVYFLNTPGNQWAVKEEEANLKIIDYKRAYPGLGKLPAFLSAYLIRREVLKIEQYVGCEFDVIWNFDSSRFFNLSQLKGKLKICHIVDMSENFQRDTLARTADICFCTSDYIAQTLRPFSREVYKIHHGYQQTMLSEPSLKEDKAAIKVAYVGNLARACIDWDIILTLIKDNPEVNFTFIGGYTHTNLSNRNLDKIILDQLVEAENVELRGTVASHKVPGIIKEFDILLCVYKMQSPGDYAQHSNLHKTMEYLGSGKVVVSSYVDEYKEQQELLKMVYKNEEIPHLFTETLNDLERLNSLENQLKRIRFAQSNSYSNQIARISDLLEKVK